MIQWRHSFFWKKYLHKITFSLTRKKKYKRIATLKRRQWRKSVNPVGNLQNKYLTTWLFVNNVSKFSCFYTGDIILWYKMYIDMLHVINHCLSDTKLILLSRQPRQPITFGVPHSKMHVHMNLHLCYVLSLLSLKFYFLWCSYSGFTFAIEPLSLLM